MKVWLKSLFKGMFIACQIIVVIGMAAILFKGLITSFLWVAAWLGRIAPTPTSIIICISICFVITFGLMWSFWE